METQTKTLTGNRIAVIITAGVLALVGAAAGAGGGLLLGVLGGDGSVASGPQTFDTSRSALVSSTAEIDDMGDVTELVGRPQVSLSATGTGRELFIGIGPADEVDRYLGSAAYDEITDFEIDPFELSRRAHHGSRQPPAPASQGFWVAEGRGSEAQLSWKVRDGDYRLVVMNADGSRAVDSEVDFELTVPHLGTIAWALTGTGILLVLGGLAALTVALRRRAR